jgi:homoserine acetyltransferase
MGCRHSSSPSNSPKLLHKNRGLKRKIFFPHSRKFPHHQKSNGMKSSISPKTFNLEQILDGHGENLIKRFEFNSICHLFDVSLTHILLLNHRQLQLIHINTMNIETSFLPIDHFDIQEIVWSTQLNLFLILTTDQLYQTGIDQLQLKPLHQIQVKFVQQNSEIVFVSVY